mmetsp:Transcript_8439/g.18956  ORF Transcript_8439/g.18956 Transcript_8439/m.18956 type:complete len:129 (+) Transcript_8439:218-604(+)
MPPVNIAILQVVIARVVVTHNDGCQVLSDDTEELQRQRDTKVNHQPSQLSHSQPDATVSPSPTDRHLRLPQFSLPSREQDPRRKARPFVSEHNMQASVSLYVFLRRDTPKLPPLHPALCPREEPCQIR